MNHWLSTPHEFEPMPEPWFRVLCIFCGGRLFSGPHHDHVGTWTRRRLLSNQTGLDGLPLAKRADPSQQR